MRHNHLAAHQASMGPQPAREAGDPAAHRLHRIRAVRERQGLSLRSVARRLNQTVTRLRQEEDESSDLPLTALYRWQQALGVPVSELLADPQDPLSSSILARARLVRIMKTARSIRESCQSRPMVFLSERLIDQLIEIMPELKEIHGWHGTGHRRTLEELGRVAEHPLPDHFLTEGMER